MCSGIGLVLVVRRRGLQPLSHAPEIGAVCLNFGTCFSCGCTTSNVIDYLRLDADFWSVYQGDYVLPLNCFHTQTLISQTVERRTAKIYQRFGPRQTHKTDSYISPTRPRILHGQKVQNLCLHFRLQLPQFQNGAAYLKSKTNSGTVNDVNAPYKIGCNSVPIFEKFGQHFAPLKKTSRGKKELNLPARAVNMETQCAMQ